MTGPVWAALLGVGPLGIHTAWQWRHAGQPIAPGESVAARTTVIETAPGTTPYDWATEPPEGRLHADDVFYTGVGWVSAQCAASLPYFPTTYTCHTAHIDQAAE